MWIQEGQKIEVQGVEDGFYGAWFLKIVLKMTTQNTYVEWSKSHKSN